MRDKADRMLSQFGSAGGDGAASAADAAKQIEWVPPYASPAVYPSDVGATRIYVDAEHDAVFLPLNGIPTPFAIKCIKNVTLTDSDGAGETILKFDFYIPPKTAAATAPKECAPAMVQVLHDLHILGAGAEAARDVAWVKVLSFRARNGENLRNVERIVKAIQKRMRAKVRDDRELLDIVQQAPLAVSARKVSLTDLEMRPNLAGRKTTGACEIHKNGIRFRSNRGEKLDVLFKNMKHAVFQPCGSSNSDVTIHIQFHQPLMMGKKKRTCVRLVVPHGVALAALPPSRSYLSLSLSLCVCCRTALTRARLLLLLRSFALCLSRSLPQLRAILYQDHRIIDQPRQGSLFDVRSRRA